MMDWLIPTCTAVNGSIIGISAVKIHRIRKERKKIDRDWHTATNHPNPGAGENSGPTAAGAAHPTENASPILEIVEQLDPIRAWKMVALQGDERTVWLASLYNQEHWQQDGHAKCLRQPSWDPPRPHQSVPEVTCSCGWYAVKNRADVAGVVAEVDLYGTVIEAERGYRAEYQRILAISIPRSYCDGGFLCDKQPKLVDFPVEMGQDRVMPRLVCRTHGTGSHAVELSQVAARLGVEVHWYEVMPSVR